MRDGDRPGVAGGGGKVRSRLEAAEEVGLLKNDAGRVRGSLTNLVRSGRPAAVRHLDDLEPEPGCIRLHDLPHLRVRRLGHDDLRSTRRVLCDEAGIGGHRRPVVARGVRDVHAGQLADCGLVLEDRLEDALAHLGLVRRVRRQELAALKHGVDDRRHVVVVDARAEKRELAGAVGIPRREVLEMPRQLLLAERRVERELAVEAHGGRDVAEQLLDRGDTDRREHLLAVAFRQ